MKNCISYTKVDYFHLRVIFFHVSTATSEFLVLNLGETHAAPILLFLFVLKMLEIGARMELRASEHQFIKETDCDLPDISFEELLAQEKKDTFW